MFELTDQPWDEAALRARLRRPEAGACVVFEGWVRNHHAGRPVDRLDYEAYGELALSEGAAVVAEAEAAHPGTQILCVHRTGTLPVGTPAVWIGAGAAHRQAAFHACRQVIEELKRRLPIWKKEHHSDGASEWVNCTTEHTAAPGSPDNYYARQTALPEVGVSGQARLGAASVLVVGLGGLGCPAAAYLAGAGVGRLTLVDDGNVEFSNLHRQILFSSEDVGLPKTTAAAGRLRAQNPFIHVEGLPERIDAANVLALVTGRTLVLDCTDNFTARFLLHDACRSASVPLVSAAVHRFEGELNVYAGRRPGCLHCQWPERLPGELDASESCATGPVFAPAVGLLGVMQASEALQWILTPPVPDAPLPSRLVDLRTGSILQLERTPHPACPVCGGGESENAIPVSDDGLFLTAEDAARLTPRPQWIALLAPGETIAGGQPATPVRLGDWEGLRVLAAGDAPLLLGCRTGVRAAAAARALRARGHTRVHALTGAAPFIRTAA